MVMPQLGRVHVERAVAGRRPTFPHGSARPGQYLLSAGSELGKQLRPNRDHPDKRHDRRQRRGFFDENLQHIRLLPCEHRGNIVPFLFFGQVAVVGQFGK